MNEFDYLKFMMELLNLMIEKFEDLEFGDYSSETIKRLNYATENLKKAYNYASPLLYRKDIR